MKWKGEILLESLNDPSLLNTFHTENIQEIQDDAGLWHVYHVVVEEHQTLSVGSFIKDGPWFIHFWNEEEMIIVFKDAYFKFLHSDRETIEKIKEYGRKMHIPEEELRFTIA